MSPAEIYATSWWQLAGMRAQLPHLPPIGVVYVESRPTT